MYQNYQQPFYNAGSVLGQMPNMTMPQRNQAQEPQYMQTMQMAQPMQQVSYVPNQIPGAIVNDFSQITANDVPMNGMGAFFFKQDGKEIQLRSWAANGTIQTTIFKPIQPEEQQDLSQQISLNDLNEDVKGLREDIRDMRSMIEKSINVSNKTVNVKNKKEADVNE